MELTILVVQGCWCTSTQASAEQIQISIREGKEGYPADGLEIVCTMVCTNVIG